MKGKPLRLTISTLLSTFSLWGLPLTIGQLSPLMAQTTEERIANQVCEQAIKGVVTIKDGKGHGSGFIVSQDGLIVTNAHVVDNSPNVVTVVFHDGRQTSADIIGFAKGGVDLALLKIYDPSQLTVLPLANPKTAKVGDRIFAIGSPLSPENQNICTSGMITKIDRKTSQITHNAETTQGNSGGPLVNSKGQVVGINTWVAKAPVYDDNGIPMGWIATGTGINLSQPVQLLHSFLGDFKSNNISSRSTIAQESEAPKIVDLSLNGQIIRGSLTEGDRQLRDGSYADLYQFEGRAGQQVTIDLKSQDFNPLLSLYKVDIQETAKGQQMKLTKVTTNDDRGPGDFNAQIQVNLPEDSLYLVISNSFEGGETGNYSLQATTNP